MGNEVTLLSGTYHLVGYDCHLGFVEESLVQLSRISAYGGFCFSLCSLNLQPKLNGAVFKQPVFSWVCNIVAAANKQESVARWQERKVLKIFWLIWKTKCEQLTLFQPWQLQHVDTRSPENSLRKIGSKPIFKKPTLQTRFPIVYYLWMLPFFFACVWLANRSSLRWGSVFALQMV